MRLIDGRKIESLTGRMARKGIDAALFVNSEPLEDPNIQYLTGFGGMMHGALVLSGEGTKLVTTELDYERALEEASADEIILLGKGKRLSRELRDICKNYGKIGIIKNRISLETADALKISRSRTVDISLLMSRERSIKCEKELAAVRESARISNKGIEFLKENIHEGQRESVIASGLEMLLGKEGSERTPFKTIVTSGPRSCFVHPTPPASSKKIGNGLGLVDFGSVSRGYCTDVTVPFAIKPDKEQQKIAETTEALADKIICEIKPGVRSSHLHKIYENALVKEGWKIKHSLGHSLGLDVHEYPSLSGHDAVLREGMTIAVEPGVYEKKSGGCRLENTIIITKKGCEKITKSKLIRMYT